MTTVYQIVYIDAEIDHSLPARPCPVCFERQLRKIKAPMVKRRLVHFCNRCKKTFEMAYEIEGDTFKAPAGAVLP